MIHSNMTVHSDYSKVEKGDSITCEHGEALLVVDKVVPLDGTGRIELVVAPIDKVKRAIIDKNGGMIGLERPV